MCLIYEVTESIYFGPAQDIQYTCKTTINSRDKMSCFDQIKRIHNTGIFYWPAEDLGIILGYSNVNAFEATIHSARRICINNGHNIAEHFIDSNTSAYRNREGYDRNSDYLLSCYACYLILHLADPRKSQVLPGRIYFAKKKCLSCNHCKLCQCTNKFKYCRFSKPKSLDNTMPDNTINKITDSKFEFR